MAKAKQALTDLFKGGAVYFGERGALALQGGIPVVFDSGRPKKTKSGRFQL